MKSQLPEFTLAPSTATPKSPPAEQTSVVKELLRLGFIYSHDIQVAHAVGRNQSAQIIACLNVNTRSYALWTDLFHQQTQLYFTNYYAPGDRLITTSKTGLLVPDPKLNLSTMPELTLTDTGEIPIESQWKLHQKQALSLFGSQHSLLLKPEQHLQVERGFYLRFLKFLLNNGMLERCDSHANGYTLKGEQTLHSALTANTDRHKPVAAAVAVAPSTQAARKPWLQSKLANIPATYQIPAGFAVAATLVAVALQVTSPQPVGPSLNSDDPSQISAQASPQTAAALSAPTSISRPPATPTETAHSAASAPLLRETESTVTAANQSASIIRTPTPQIPANTEVTPVDNMHPDFRVSQALPIPGEPATTTAEAKPAPPPPAPIVASANDEMWRISVENAEFYLLSNDGDPKPWIRSAKRIAASFDNNDPRLARTYFLSALVEKDYLVAEMHYQRALKIQKTSLGLYNAETAQTLEAMAWLSEHHKDAIEEAISHQRLAVNIYRKVYGDAAEDTQAAIWKLQYFEHRLAGSTHKSDEKRRLLPALAKFDR